MDNDQAQGEGSGAAAGLDGKKVKVGIGIPNEGHCDPLAYDNRLEMFFHLGRLQEREKQFEFHLLTVGNVFVSLAREKIAEYAQTGGMDYLLMIDDDMICPVDLFERLYERKADIIAPLAFSRFPPHKPVIYKLNSGYDPLTYRNYYINYSVYDYPRDTLFQCDAVGFGAVLIDMKVFKELEKPWFQVMSGAGEDIHFCYQAAKKGFKTFCDTSVKLGHVGCPNIITEETFDSPQNREMLIRIHNK